MSKRNKKGVVVLSVLELDILTVLKGGTFYGLEILERINTARSKVGMNKLGIGSLYPTLQRMEKAELVNVRKPNKGKDSSRRKYYYISSEGEKAIGLTHTYREWLL